ncbi:MAG: hypothetical protein ICV84_24420 [Flavisolibacter sp.]|nr:hypothetical protein [Flavisolibacter sp.]
MKQKQENTQRRKKIELLVALAKGEKLPEDVLNELPVSPNWLLALVPRADDNCPVPTEEDNVRHIKEIYGEQTIIIKRPGGYILLNKMEPVREKPDWMTEPPGKIDDE